MAKLPTIDTNIKSKRIPLKVLFLDPNNYRFIDHQDYKQIDIADIFDARVQLRTIEFITGKNNEQIKDLIDSFKKNGYLPVDQIQVEEIGTNQFKVVEGNRRIATLKYLEQQYKNNKDIGELDPEIFNKIPVVYYDKVDESHHYILMGLKHISGNKKWPPLNQAQLLHDLIKVYNMTEDDVCKAIGIGKLKLRKSLRALSLIEEYKNSDYGEQFETDMYSVFEEAVNKPDIRVWLDWNDDTYKPESKLNTERFFSWISNETITIDIQEEDGEPIEKELEKIIGKSSDIRDLATFINDPQALKKMEESRSVSQAYSSSSKVGKEVLNETLQSIEYELKVAMAHSYHFNDSTLLRLTSIDKLFKSLVGATGATSLLASEDVSKNVLVTCTNSFFTEIEISNYKVHKNLKLDKLNRLNVFAGINNSGKSSLLEAIYLLCRQNDIYSLFDVLKKRHKMNELDSRWVANNFSINSSIKGIYDGKECEVQVSNEPEISSAFDKTGYLSTITLNGKLAHKILSSSTRLYNGRTNETKYDMVNILCNSVISTPYSVSTSNEILKYHEAAVSTKAIDRILSFMRDQVEKDLIDIQLVSDFNRFLVNHKNIERAIDLSQFGEGFQRIFMICLEFASAQDGVILIDELESAIHFKLLRSFVDFINKLSLEFNVQVFITSHSKECINTIVSIQSEDVSAYSLSIQSNGESKCKYISGDDLAFLISQMDADLREAK